MSDLSHLKAGDSVLLYRGYYNDTPEIEKIERVTSTQIILTTGARFRRKYGNRVGDSGYHRSSIRGTTPEEIQTVRKTHQRKRLADELMDVKWRDMPLSKLIAVKAALDQPTP